MRPAAILDERAHQLRPRGTELSVQSLNCIRRRDKADGFDATRIVDPGANNSRKSESPAALRLPGERIETKLKSG
jgi:hypothetical protein